MKLRIFITNSKSGAFFYICNGLARAFRAAGHEAILWDGNQNEWRLNPPDIYIGCSGWRQKIIQSQKTKIAIHTNPWCSEIIRVPGGPVINDNDSAIRWTTSQRPNVVFGYGLQQDMERYWSFWKSKAGIKLVGMPNAADAILYKRVPKDINHSVDIGWVGGYWKYKAINLDKYLVPVARKHNTIWYGHSGPKEKYYKGKVDNENLVLKLFSSAKVCPAVVEPHTTKYGIDIPERIFKLGCVGAMVVADPVAGLDRYFSDGSVIIARNQKDFSDLCDYWINVSEEKRALQASRLHREVITKHTYFNRIQVLLRALGYENEAKEIDAFIPSA